MFALWFRAFGTRFRLGSDDRDVLTAVSARAAMLGWTPSVETTPAVTYDVRRRGGDLDLLCDGSVVSTQPALGLLVDAFEDHAHLETAYRADEVFVHAGAVAWRGRGIVLPGRSHAGKSTLVAALVRAGALCYSDDYAVIDRAGLLRPTTMPLSIRHNGAARGIKTTAQALGGRLGEDPVPIDLVVMTQYRRGARWRPQPLTAGETLLALMGNTVSATRPPEHTMPVLAQVVRRAKGLKSSRGDARRIVDALLAEIA